MNAVACDLIQAQIAEREKEIENLRQQQATIRQQAQESTDRFTSALTEIRDRITLAEGARQQCQLLLEGEPKPAEVAEAAGGNNSPKAPTATEKVATDGELSAANPAESG